MAQGTLKKIVSTVRKPRELEAGSPNQTLIQLVGNDEGFSFRSEKKARRDPNVGPLLDMELAVWEPGKVLGIKLRGKVRLNPSVRRTLKNR